MSATSEDLPQSFWATPQAVVLSESLQLLHAELCARLREEAQVSGPDTLHMMMAERVATMSIITRSKETTASFAHDRSWKETNQLLWQMMKDLAALRENRTGAEAIKNSVLSAVATAMQTVLDDMPPAQAKKLRDSLQVAFEEAAL